MPQSDGRVVHLVGDLTSLFFPDSPTTIHDFLPAQLALVDGYKVRVDFSICDVVFRMNSENGELKDQPVMTFIFLPKREERRSGAAEPVSNIRRRELYKIATFIKKRREEDNELYTVTFVTEEYEEDLQEIAALAGAVGNEVRGDIAKFKTLIWMASHSIGLGLVARRQIELRLEAEKKARKAKREALKAKKDKDKSAEESLKDDLTGLISRRGLFRFGEELVKRAVSLRSNTERSAITFFFIDLNNFKPVNDNLGHDAGDVFLRMMGRILKDLFHREWGDVAARYGGDEFVVISAHTDKRHAQRLVKTIRRRMREERPMYEGKLISYEFSATIASETYNPDCIRGVTFEDLVKKVDKKGIRLKRAWRTRRGIKSRAE